MNIPVQHMVADCIFSDLFAHVQSQVNASPTHRLSNLTGKFTYLCPCSAVSPIVSHPENHRKWVL